MNKLVLLAILTIFSISLQAQDKVNWLTFEQAIEKNKEHPKPILVDLYTNWCGWCKKMDKTTYKNDIIVQYINENYYAVKMNGEDKNDITFKGKTYKYIKKGRVKYHELAAQIMRGKMSYPSTAFFDTKERLIQTVPGYLSEKRFEKILAYFTKDTYKKTKWSVFEKDFENKI